MFGVRYKVFNKVGGLVLDEGTVEGEPAADCFSEYNRQTFHGYVGGKWGNHIIECYFDKDPNFITTEQITYHLQHLKDVFPTSFTETEKEYAIKLREQDYINHTHMRAALDFIRVLWENNVRLVMPPCFEYIKIHGLKFDYFVILQAIFTWAVVLGKITNGHYLPSYSYYGKTGIITTEEFMTALKTDVPETQNRGSKVLWEWVVEQKNPKNAENQSVDWRRLEKHQKRMEEVFGATSPKDQDFIKKILQVTNEK